MLFRSPLRVLLGGVDANSAKLSSLENGTTCMVPFSQQVKATQIAQPCTRVLRFAQYASFALLSTLENGDHRSDPILL